MLPGFLLSWVPAVIACDKREAFAQGSNATKQSTLFLCVAKWIASRSLSSGAFARPVGPQGQKYNFGISEFNLTAG
jgi:hypothetical protein